LSHQKIDAFSLETQIPNKLLELVWDLASGEKCPFIDGTSMFAAGQG